MADFLIIPGAGGAAWPWHLVVEELESRGHRAVAVDLPADDESAGLEQYEQAAVEAAGAAGFDSDVVAVGHSFGGFTAPLLTQSLPVIGIVLYCAMVPNPGERGGDWWDATGYTSEKKLYEGDIEAAFFNGVDPLLATAAMEHDRDQAGAPFEEPWPLPAWPSVPVRFLLSADDLFFPAGFMRELALDRLGIEADEMPGGHMSMLSHPGELADRLAGYAAEFTG